MLILTAIQIMSMLQLIFIASLSIFIAGLQSSSLPDERKVCKLQDISYIPDENDYDLIHLELVLDSSISLNHVLATRILQEECGLIEKELSFIPRREKRSHIARGIFRLSKWFLHFYQQSRKFLRPELLKDIKNVVDKLHHIKTPMGKVKFAGIGKFFYEMWKDVNQVRAEAKDAHFDLMLEQTLRTSLQLLINNNELSEILLNHPSISDKIKTKIPISNAKLLSEVKAIDVHCQPLNRDSQAAIYLKLKIPRIQNITVEKVGRRVDSLLFYCNFQCDDIGKMKGNTYQYYVLPTATFERNETVFAVELGKCVLENFIFCPPTTIQEATCSMNNIKQCLSKEEPDQTNFVRELQSGFAVFGSFTQVISTKHGLNDLFNVQPHHLYHVVPQEGAIVSIGGNILNQFTSSENTTVRRIGN
ncbi:hypothetical protein CAEBREN_02006 [Caenorhabditis brenneri]|uniref:Uncharacterized protein n=1 Tax=Caenorhabditis brenneri TaxID=135651 RepID=G0N8X5_CAEBE|nr:hypothetical protein CAEBREN_02006 [Caenorhabditis brenneri]